MALAVKPASALFQKDVRSELRTRYTLNALLMFVVISISVVLFSVAGETLQPEITIGMLWIVMFFSAMSGMSRTFVAEEEKGTTMTLQLLASPSSIYAGKLLFNLLLIVCLNAVIVVLFLLTMEKFAISQPGLFWLVILLGGFGIASATTIIAAIIAKARTKGTLFPVLSFPILLPLIMAGISATKTAVMGTTWEAAIPDLQLLVSYIVVVITTSFLLFDYVWKD
ncbi:MAG: ABC transporter permease [Ectothiorhodospiraceae bacterium]|nr:ABC transporter permease [Ectothiorhodospiraceae bacterium]